MMIYALHFEPQGQRQRFEPQEPQRAERGEQNRHIHLHLHLNPTLRASQKRSTHPNAMRITKICAALLAATVMPLGVFIFALGIHEGLFQIMCISYAQLALIPACFLHTFTQLSRWPRAPVKLTLAKQAPASLV